MSESQIIDAKKLKQKEYYREWYQKHRDEQIKHMSEYYHQHRDEVLEYHRKRYRENNKNSFSLKPGSTEFTCDNVCEYINSEMKQVQSNEYYDKFVSICKSHNMSDNEINEVNELILKARSAKASRRGFGFERVIQNVLLSRMNQAGLHLYRQVPVNDSKCRIDFVVSATNTNVYDLDLSECVIVSTKTGFSTAWREDMHLYDKCKLYIMITMSTYVPREQLGPNVYFASTRVTQDSNNLITIDSAIAKIIEALTPRDTQSEQLNQ